MLAAHAQLSRVPPAPDYPRRLGPPQQERAAVFGSLREKEEREERVRSLTAQGILALLQQEAHGERGATLKGQIFFALSHRPTHIAPFRLAIDAGLATLET